MCYSTKKKIADCVRQLMKRKEISKITIGDIMEATGMSRQSFYYHFKDIYDVLEWIGCNDFKDQLQGQYDSMEKWACDLMEVLQRDAQLYEKLANELCVADDRAWCTHGVGCAGAPSAAWRESGHV